MQDPFHAVDIVVQRIGQVSQRHQFHREAFVNSILPTVSSPVSWDNTMLSSPLPTTFRSSPSQPFGSFPFGHCPPVPSGSSTRTQVLNTLRSLHEHYLSIITTFISHVRTYSPTSHTCNIQLLRDLAEQIRESGSKILTLIEAGWKHINAHKNRPANLKTATKEEPCQSPVESLIYSIYLLSLSLPLPTSYVMDKDILLQAAMQTIKASSDCVTALIVCLPIEAVDNRFSIYVPPVKDFFTELLPQTQPGRPLSSSSSTNHSPASESSSGSDFEIISTEEIESMSSSSNPESPDKAGRRKDAAEYGEDGDDKETEKMSEEDIHCNLFALALAERLSAQAYFST